MGDYATLSDIEADYGPIPTEKQAKVERDIDRVEALLRLEDPTLDQRVVDGSLPEILLNQVICEIVIAPLKNPLGVRSFTQTAGPFSGSQTFADGTSGYLELSDRQRELLGLQARATRAFTITPRPARHPAFLPPDCQP